MTRRKRTIGAMLLPVLLALTACAAPKTPESAAQADRPPIVEEPALCGFSDEERVTDADLRYESDTLRIAIRRYEDPENRQIYYVADIRMRSIRSFRAGFANGAFNRGVENAEAFSLRENAILAINGSFNTGLVVHDGTVYQMPDDRHDGILILYRDGSMEAIGREAFDLAEAREKGMLHAWQFGPVLVHEGKANPALLTDGFKARHARILFGCCAPGHYVAVAADGRRKDAIGMDERDMAELMVSLGCTEAMNLDGGCSAIMTFMGKTVNDPPQTGADDPDGGGRNLADMLLFAAYDTDDGMPSGKEPQE